jgi:hypothetical protein
MLQSIGSDQQVGSMLLVAAEEKERLAVQIVSKRV